MPELPISDDDDVVSGAGAPAEPAGDDSDLSRWIDAENVVSATDELSADVAVRAEVLALDLEAQRDLDVAGLMAADAAVAAAAAERIRMIDRVRQTSLVTDALRSKAMDVHNRARLDRADAARRSDAGVATPASTASPAESPRAAGGLHATSAIRSREISERSARAEIALALGMSEAGAGSLVETAESMRRQHPAVLAAMRAGLIRERHATRLVASVVELPIDAAERVVAAALPLSDRAFSKFSALVDRLVQREHPQTLEERHARAFEDRAAWITDDRDGMSVLSQLMPSVDAHAILNRAKSMAKVLKNRVPGTSAGADIASGADISADAFSADAAIGTESRTTKQLVADILRDLQLDGETGVLPNEVRGIRPTVFITVPALSAATGNADFGAAEVDGVGPISLTTAVELIGKNSEWTRIVTHPVTGMILDIDRKKYRPPAALARIVRWAYGTCTFPGCRTAAHRCELDHIHDWNNGGGTSFCNLHPLCTGHHTVKHATQWKVHSNPGGGVTFTSPGGQTSTTLPKAPWRHSSPPKPTPTPALSTYDDPAPF